MGRTARVRGRPERRRIGQDLVEPAEIVEADLSGRQPQRLGHLRPAVQAQQAITDSPLGNPAQLLLDRLQGGPRLVGSAQLETHRIQRREPANGSGQIHVLEQLLATMPLKDQPM